MVVVLLDEVGPIATPDLYAICFLVHVSKNGTVSKRYLNCIRGSNVKLEALNRMVKKLMKFHFCLQKQYNAKSAQRVAKNFLLPK